MRPKPLAKASVHAYMRAINSFLAWVRKEGEKVEAKAPLPKLSRPVIDVLTRSEIQAMEDAAASERDKLIVRLLADTGIRLSELLGLRTADLLEGEGKHAFLKIRGKGDKERLVPVAAALARQLRRFAEKTRKETNYERIFISMRRGPAAASTGGSRRRGSASWSTSWPMRRGSPSGCTPTCSATPLPRRCCGRG
jgi:integrase